MRIVIRVSRNSPHINSPHIRINRQLRLRSPLFCTLAGTRLPLGPVAASMAVHAALFGLALLGPALPISDQETLYAQVIGPHRHQLVWYNFSRKLPPISSPDMEDWLVRHAQVVRAGQTIVSNPRRAEDGAQMVYLPSRPAQPQPQLRRSSATVLAFRLPLITPPSSTPLLQPSEHLERRSLEARLPGPHQVAGPLPSGSSPPAPVRALETTGTPQRAFVPPTPEPADLMNTPLPPIMEAPTADIAGLPSSDVAIAIVGSNPAVTLNRLLPEASIPAKFSAGPSGEVAKASLNSVLEPSLIVPGLLVRDGSHLTSTADLIAITRAKPTSRETLEAAARVAAMQQGRDTSEIHTMPPPDPSFDGRDVYSFAVQMPNIVSYSGSWLMWFAEREPLGPRQELQPPVPLRKVDPKYLPSAISEGVEGNVVLSGVLQSNGKIREITILKGVDARLDLNAVRALFKWEFRAAQRNGIPVEMDMVAVIPFLLGPHVRH